MRGKLAAAVVASLLVAALVAAPGVGAQTAVTDQDRLETALVKRVNAVRQARGLSKLRAAARLTRAADRHAASMATAGYFRHELLRRKSSRWVPFGTWIRTFWPGPGATAWGAGENLAWGAPGLSARQTVRNWMRSPGHRANLLNRSWRRIGVAAVHVEGPVGTYGSWDEVTIVVAEFGFRR